MLMIATVGLVFGFRTSTNLAAAYGMAVTTTMVITTLLAYFVARERWRWSVWRARRWSRRRSSSIDLTFFGANVVEDRARRLVPAAWSPALDLRDDVDVAHGPPAGRRAAGRDRRCRSTRFFASSRRSRRCACRARRSS